MIFEILHMYTFFKKSKNNVKIRQNTYANHRFSIFAAVTMIKNNVFVPIQITIFNFLLLFFILIIIFCKMRTYAIYFFLFLHRYKLRFFYVLQNHVPMQNRIFPILLQKKRNFGNFVPMQIAGFQFSLHTGTKLPAHHNQITCTP